MAAMAAGGAQPAAWTARPPGADGSPPDCPAVRRGPAAGRHHLAENRKGWLASGTSSLLPGRITSGSYSADLTQTSSAGLNFGRSLLNSTIVALSTTAITVVIALLAGYALSRTRMRGKGPVLGFVLIAGFFPPLAMVGPLFWPTAGSAS